MMNMLVEEVRSGRAHHSLRGLDGEQRVSRDLQGEFARRACITSSVGHDLVHQPDLQRRSALSVRPVKISSDAFAQPSIRGRDQVPPRFGSTPRLAREAPAWPTGPSS